MFSYYKYNHFKHRVCAVTLYDDLQKTKLKKKSHVFILCQYFIVVILKKSIKWYNNDFKNVVCNLHSIHSFVQKIVDDQKAV